MLKLKTIQLFDKSVFEKNNIWKQISGKNNDDDKISRFNICDNSIKFTKKLEKILNLKNCWKMKIY